MTTTDDRIDLRTYLEPVRRNLWVLALFCATATLTSLLFTYVVSEKYVASAVILQQPREDVSFQPKARDALGFPLPLIPLESIANTLEDILKSDRVLEQAVRSLHLDEKRTLPSSNWLVQAFRDAKDKVKEWRSDAWQILKFGRILPKNLFLAAVANLHKNTSIKRTNKAYTFRLQVLDDDPERAARTVDKLGELLSVAVLQEQTRSARESRQNIEVRLANAGRELQRIRGELNKFRNATGISSLDDELSLRINAISEFQDDVEKVGNDLKALEERRSALKGQLDSQEALVTYSTTTEDNPVFKQLKSQEAALLVERSGLLERMTPENRKVKEVEAKLAETRHRLSVEPEKRQSSLSTRRSDVHEKLLSEKLTVYSEIQALREKQVSLVRTIAVERTTTRKLTEAQPQWAQINLHLRASEHSYDLINQAYQEALLAEMRTVSEVVMQEHAVIPSQPTRPIKVVHVGVTLVLSMTIGIAWIFLVDFFDTSIRSINTAERVLGVPVFASIPPLKESEGGQLAKSAGI